MDTSIAKPQVMEGCIFAPFYALVLAIVLIIFISIYELNLQCQFGHMCFVKFIYLSYRCSTKSCQKIINIIYNEISIVFLICVT